MIYYKSSKKQITNIKRKKEVMYYGKHNKESNKERQLCKGT